jgi:hypothetical protein
MEKLFCILIATTISIGCENHSKVKLDNRKSNSKNGSLPNNGANQSKIEGLGNIAIQSESFTLKLKSIATQRALEKSCGSCHGETSSGGLGNITNLHKLIAKGYVVPAKSNESSLITRIKLNMPPSGSPAMPEKDLATVESWIAEGAIIDNKKLDRKAISVEQVYLLSLNSALKHPVSQRPNLRYLSLATLYNSGFSDDYLDIVRDGITKMVNSISNSTSLSRVPHVDENKVIYEIDLSKYSLSIDSWKDLEKFYPYFVLPAKIEPLAALREDTQSQAPVFRADWFINTAGQPPAYYFLQDLPSKKGDFTTAIGITEVPNLEASNIIRAGFDNSKVSENHRVIERHENGESKMWQSYEFGSTSIEKDIFKNPLGPNKVFGSAKSFQPGGNEIIYTKPNGMIAFAIFDKEGRLMHDAPPLRDDQDKVIKEISAGAVCMSCHFEGFIEAEDQVRKRHDPALRQEDIRIVNQIYLRPSDFNTILRNDSAIYKKKLEAISLGKKIEPVSAVSRRFSLNLDMSTVSAELMVSQEGFKKALALSPVLTTKFASLIDKGSISRSAFTKIFADSVVLLHGSE